MNRVSRLAAGNAVRGGINIPRGYPIQDGEGGGEMPARDGVVVGTMAGMLAALAKDAVNLALSRLDHGIMPYWQMAARTFVRADEAMTLGGWAAGALIDLILGGGLGLIVLLILRHFGRDYWWYKALVAGKAVWLLGYVFGVHFLTPLGNRTPIGFMAAFLDHQVFGFVVVYLNCRWAAPAVRMAGNRRGR